MASTTPTYRVEFSGVVALKSYGFESVVHTPAAWNVKRAGRPTEANLALYIEALEHSTCPGECNEHLGQTRVGSARIFRQANDETVAAYAAPMFQVVS